MSLFKRNFKEKKEEERVSNFFPFPRNEEGFKKVSQWLTESEELIAELQEGGELQVLSTPEGKIVLPIYTDVRARRPAFRKGEHFAVMRFEDLKNIMEANPQISFVWLNRYSDSVQFERRFFSKQYVIPKETTIKIGLPASIPEKLIDFLIDYGQNHSSIKKISFALMQNGEEFSYLVNIQDAEKEIIIPEIEKAVEQISQRENYRYPVDFTSDEELFGNDSSYVIYQSLKE